MSTVFTALTFTNQDVSFNGEVTIAKIVGPSELVIDPAAVGDNTGTVRIKGGLIVDGSTTTLNSINVDISDKNINLAYDVSLSIADGAGITVGISGGDQAKLTYNDSDREWEFNLPLDISNELRIGGNSVLTANSLGSNVYDSSLQSLGTLNSLSVSGNLNLSGDLYIDSDNNIYIDGVSGTAGQVLKINDSGIISWGSDSGLTNFSDASFGTVDISNLNVFNEASFNSSVNIIGNLTVSGDVLPDNSGRIPVTYNTFAVKNDNLNTIYTTSSEQWIIASGYDISITPISQNSHIKLEYKINYICSNEYGQRISFRVCKDTSTSIIFTDSNIGSSMGVGNQGVYNGTFITGRVGSTNETNYQLYFKANDLNNNIIDSSSLGILGDSSYSNYIYAQELYKP
tara:strand:+ start:30 stop:1229 length:1200 start_codon:yes stop_codon:yes gene_type:complete